MFLFVSECLNYSNPKVGWVVRGTGRRTSGVPRKAPKEKEQERKEEKEGPTTGTRMMRGKEKGTTPKDTTTEKAKNRNRKRNSGWSS